MKNCPNCGMSLQDDAKFCKSCGTPLAVAPEAAGQPAAAQGTVPPAPQAAQQQPAGAPYTPATPYAPPTAVAYDPNDHTAEFNPQDICDNKVFALLAYLLGPLGIIMCLINKESRFARFHALQAGRFLVVELVTAVLVALLAWTLIVPVAAGIFLCVLLVCEIIAFCSCASGKAKTAPVIRSFKFLY